MNTAPNTALYPGFAKKCDGPATELGEKMRHHGESLKKLLSGKEWKWFIKYTHNVAATLK